MTDLDDAIIALRREARALPPGTLRNMIETRTASDYRHVRPGRSWMVDVIAGPAPCAACGRGRLWLVNVARGHSFPVLAWRERAYGIHRCPEVPA